MWNMLISILIVSIFITRNVQSACEGETVPLYRYWSPGGSDHFYTTNWDELKGGKDGYNFEGILGYVYPTQADGTVPLYRYWNSGIADHFYTTSWSELEGGRGGWTFEFIQCYVYPKNYPSTEGTKTNPVYRYWNGANGDHFYTASYEELGSGRGGWGLEGIEAHVCQVQSSNIIEEEKVSPGYIIDPLAYVDRKGNIFCTREEQTITSRSN